MKQKEKIVSKKIFSAKTIAKWIGWGIVYIVVFYLGNVTGEYVAANMPVFSLKMPSVNLQMPQISADIPQISIQIPRLSVQFNVGALKPWIDRLQPKVSKVVPQKVTTKTVVVAGNILSMPVDGATSEEKQAFEQSIARLAVSASAVSVQGVCDLTPAFITLKKGVSVQITNKTNTPHDVAMSTQSQTIPSWQTVTVPVTQEPGAYPMHCDTQIAGFYLVTQ